ncbi:MAG: LysR family transcriptional regulator substrate-binding protein [Prochlorococcaceae cyanobacterium MAG_34]|nr:LysR family transcriptional regulator substrate-binding protein [Prochlorococcaceae cyanobacterium MAG_34]
MVNLDALTALDALQWLRTCEEVSKRFGLSQATVSRQSRKCLDLFGLDFQRIEGEWNTVGDATILALERCVHQVARWQGRRPLRLEATYWSGPLLCTPVPDSWILGLANIVGVPRNFQLVRERIVDACLTGLPDCPPAGDPELTSIALSKMPVFFVVRPGHPLISQAQLSFADIAHYPTLGLPSGAYPRVEACLKKLGFWNDHVRMFRYKRENWEGKTEAELTIGYATSLSMEVSGGDLVKLPLELPFASGEVLVCHRDFIGHPRLLSLQSLLLSRLAGLAERHRDVQLLGNL